MTSAEGLLLVNSFFHQWGFVGGLAAVLVIPIGFAAWLLREDQRGIQKATLRLRSQLAGAFQTTVANEARRLVRIAEAYLPDTLSQADVAARRPSAFDRLCSALRELDPADTERSAYRTVIENALAGEVSRELDLLLGAVGAPEMLQGSPSAISGRFRGVPYNLEEKAEVTLSIIAKETERCERRERFCNASRSLSLALFSLSVASGLVAVFVGAFVNASWAEHTAFVGCGVAVMGTLLATTGTVAYCIVKERHRRITHPREAGGTRPHGSA